MALSHSILYRVSEVIGIKLSTSWWLLKIYHWLRSGSVFRGRLTNNMAPVSDSLRRSLGVFFYYKLRQMKVLWVSSLDGHSKAFTYLVFLTMLYIALTMLYIALRKRNIYLPPPHLVYLLMSLIFITNWTLLN